MRQFLQCHSTTPCTFVQTLFCDVLILENGDLQLSYCLEGDLQNLLIPESAPSEQTDKLWEHSCFEAFISIEGQSAYYEYNFSSSSQWAAYAFSDYREISAWNITHPLQIHCEQQGQKLTMQVTLAKTILPTNPVNKAFQIGLSAVVETNKGDLSYWALKHVSNNPDFHHRDSFIHQLKIS